jgi:hypothetical protein
MNLYILSILLRTRFLIESGEFQFLCIAFAVATEEEFGDGIGTCCRGIFVATGGVHRLIRDFLTYHDSFIWDYAAASEAFPTKHPATSGDPWWIGDIEQCRIARLRYIDALINRYS